MLTIPFVSSSSLGASELAWKQWVDFILQKKELRITKAAMVYQASGVVAASSQGFHLSARDIQSIRNVLDDGNNNHVEKIVFQGHSFIMKSVEGGNFMAFNGGKYLMVCRSQRMLVVTVCSSRKKSKDAADWLRILRKKLVQNNF